MRGTCHSESSAAPAGERIAFGSFVRSETQTSLPLGTFRSPKLETAVLADTFHVRKETGLAGRGDGRLDTNRLTQHGVMQTELPGALVQPTDNSWVAQLVRVPLPFEGGGPARIVSIVPLSAESVSSADMVSPPELEEAAWLTACAPLAVTAWAEKIEWLIKSDTAGEASRLEGAIR